METLQRMIDGRFTAPIALLPLVARKILATSLVVGSGGVFAPSLFIGGGTGGVVATAFGFGAPAVFVVAGMGALLAGSTKAPVSSVVMLTEMIGGYGMLMPLLVAVIVSYIVSGDHTAYDRQITSRSFPVDLTVLSDVPVEKVMKREVVTLPLTASLSEAHATVKGASHYSYPAVDEEGRMKGVVIREDVLAAHRAAPHDPIQKILQSHFETASPEERALEAFDRMNQKQVFRLYVVDEKGRLAGILTRLDLFEAAEYVSRLGGL
jgi:CIC family chloride channel protein